MTLPNCLRAETEGAVAHIGIVCRLAPGRAHARRDARSASCASSVAIVLERSVASSPPAASASSKRLATSSARRPPRNPRSARSSSSAMHARRHVEPDRIAGAARRAGIIRHQHRDPPLAARRRLQAHQRRDAVGDHRRRGPARAGSRAPVKARPSCAGSGSLKAIAPASMRPSSSGSTTCMARSAAPSPRGAVAPGGAPGGGD